MATVTGNILKKTLNKVGGFNGVLNAGFGVMAYSDARDEGKGIAASAASGIVDMALPAIIGPWKYMAGMAASAIPGAAMSGMETLGTASRQLAQAGRNVPFGNTTFVDTEQAYTVMTSSSAHNSLKHELRRSATKIQ